LAAPPRPRSRPSSTAAASRVERCAGEMIEPHRILPT
jgi:hypothetical protein